MGKQLVLIVVCSFLFSFTLNSVRRFGFFRQTFDHAPGPCRRLPGIEYGSEDIEVLPNGLAFISSGYIASCQTCGDRPGRIYLFDFNNPNEEPQELSINADDASYELISPHGLSVWTDHKTGEIYLYVVSHEPVEAIDKFKFEETSRTLTHLRRFSSDPTFHRLNDLFVIAEDQFYFTNWFYMFEKLEAFLGTCWGSIGFFNGTAGTLVQSGLCMPNGIMMSPDRKYLYVSHLGTQSLLVYTRDYNNVLTFNNSIILWTLADNLNVDEATGDIWIGAHPIGYQVVFYLQNPENLSPSQVLRIKMSDGQVVKIEEIYSNSGVELSGSSVAVPYGKGLLIGTVLTDLLYCEMK